MKKGTAIDTRTNSNEYRGVYHVLVPFNQWTLLHDIVWKKSSTLDHNMSLWDFNYKTAFYADSDSVATL